jgi:hypothetical protein
MDLTQEITNHLEWIDSIASLLNNEQLSEDDLQEISAHNQCELGHWLDSDESSVFNDLPAFQKLTESHQQFHKLAGDLLSSLQQGNENEAIAAQEKFIQMSHQVISSLQALEQMGQ